MTCIECRFYSMWDGVCMHPTSPNLWKSCFDINGGYKKACKLFEPEIIDGEVMAKLKE